MSTNLATLMVGLGYDLSALEKGSPEAFRLISQQTLGMSAEMKRSAREGAEAFRSIDEMIGIHINRPMTRLLVETFPQFGKALSDILGGVAFGAVAFAGYELFERVSRGIEAAKKATEEFNKSSIAAGETNELVLGQLAARLAELKGDNEIKFRVEGANEAQSAIERLEKAMDKAQADAEKASGFLHTVWTDAGLAADAIGHGAATLWRQSASPLGDTGKEHRDEVENMKDAFADMRTDLDAALNTDRAKGTHDALKLIQTDVQAATAYLKDMEKAGDEASAALARTAKEFFSNAQIVEKGNLQAAGIDTQNARAEAAKKSIHDLQDELKGWNEENTKAFQSWVNLNAELDKAVAKLNENVFKETGARAKQFGLGTAVLPPSGAPVLSDQLELAKLTGHMPGETSIEQQTEAWSKAAQILDQIETPLQKYQTGLAVLKELEDEGRISAAQHAAAQQLLGEKMTEAELHLQEMEKELEKLLSRSTSAAAGMHAFFLEIQIEAAQNGKFAFDVLTQALHGFNDEVAKAITTGKANWKEYFRSLDEMAIKFFLTKAEGGALKGLASLIPGATQGQSGAQGTPGESGSAPSGVGGFAGMIGKILGGNAPNVPSAGQQAAITANTAGLTANTSALTALTARMSVPSVPSLGGSDSGEGVGGGSLDSLFPDIPGFATGTDSAPGGFAWVGEQGPELMNVPAGASITPNGAARGGDTHVYQDFRGAVVSEELMRKADFQRAMNAMRPGIIGEAIANFSEVQKRTPKR